MRVFFGVAVAAGCLASAAPAAAQGGAFCATLTSAWTAGRDNPKSLGSYGLAGADHCALSDDGDLLCTWRRANKDEGRKLYRSLGRAATACLASRGLKPVSKPVRGMETTSLETPTAAPNVAVFYPGGSTVTISIVTAP